MLLLSRLLGQLEGKPDLPGPSFDTMRATMTANLTHRTWRAMDREKKTILRVSWEFLSLIHCDSTHLGFLSGCKASFAMPPSDKSDLVTRE